MTRSRCYDRRPRDALISRAEYLKAERAAERKHELHDGIVVAMAGGSPTHGFLAGALAEILGRQLRPKECSVGTSDVRVRVPDRPSYFYPDLLIVCGPPQTEDAQRDVLLNPSAVIEVLSPSTEQHDRGPKATAYRTIPSLNTFILVSQEEPRLEWHERAGDFWALREAAGMDAVATLQHLNATIPLADLYAGIEFPPRPTPESAPEGSAS